ncbi:MAG: TIGR00159 family protein [Thermonema sp.]|jgi:uncharacterized protein (TIGR00159 family)|uniref:diadenylate cyclase CdaA n=1 Tax=Thermonema TaxID=28194 RepID=UPI0005710D0F|nr:MULTISPECIES: diadenylate cyclase CdaA [Thermonema]GIV39237.1 MAG: TIGR00159 family protein [Thermonema sp.]
MLLLAVGFLEIKFVHILDILLVGFLIFRLYKLVKGSIAVPILLGVFSLYIVYLIVDALGLELLSSILGQFLGVGVLAAIVIFQPEIRKFLLFIGRSTFNKERPWVWWRPKQEVGVDLSAILDAAKAMSATNTGALIVLSRSNDLKFYADTGDRLDALLSKRLLLAIFNKYSPLHDGAVIIGRNGRIVAARCILPVTENDQVPAQLGLRHRSAIGLSEVSDAVVLVVSEETGQISLVVDGKIYRDITLQEMRKVLKGLLSSGNWIERSVEELLGEEKNAVSA